jgi:hypothetical protein
MPSSMPSPTLYIMTQQQIRTPVHYNGRSEKATFGSRRAGLWKQAGMSLFPALTVYLCHSYGVN